MNNNDLNPGKEVEKDQNLCLLKTNEAILGKLRNIESLDEIGEIKDLEPCIRLFKKQVVESNNPQDAFFSIGLSYILLGDVYNSLNAYAKAVSFHTDAQKTKIALKLILTIIDLTKNSCSQKQKQDLETVRKFLMVAGCIFKDSQRPKDFESLKRLAIQEYRIEDTPVLIIAGGSNKAYEKRILIYKALLDEALKNYSGIVFSGGTDDGVGRLAGDLSSDQIQKIAYFPKSNPDNIQKHDGYVIVETDGIGFSPLEPIQTWIDIIASGKKPAEVKLLGINGGKIASIEFRMALAFGADVGIISDSGRAAQALLDDPDWIGHPRLHQLPNAPIAVRKFCFGIR